MLLFLVPGHCSVYLLCNLLMDCVETDPFESFSSVNFLLSSFWVCLQTVHVCLPFWAVNSSQADSDLHSFQHWTMCLAPSFLCCHVANSQAPRLVPLPSLRLVMVLANFVQHCLMHKWCRPVPSHNEQHFSFLGMDLEVSLPSGSFLPSFLKTWAPTPIAPSTIQSQQEHPVLSEQSQALPLPELSSAVKIYQGRGGHFTFLSKGGVSSEFHSFGCFYLELCELLGCTTVTSQLLSPMP